MKNYHWWCAKDYVFSVIKNAFCISQYSVYFKNIILYDKLRLLMLKE